MNSNIPISLRLQMRKRKKRWSRFFTTIFLIVFLLLVIDNFKNSHSSTLVSPLSVLGVQKDGENNSIKYNSLKEAVEGSLAGSKGEYGVVVKNLKTGETYSKNENQEFESGSLYKLWVMAETFNQLEKGIIREDDELKESIPGLNREFGIDPEYAEQTSGFINLTVKEALHQMITISHNYSALSLSKKIKLPSIKSFLEDNGFEKSEVGTGGDNPVSTPSDITLFFEKLYKGELVSKEVSEKMLELLKKQELNNKLPKKLPENITVAHKTGEIGWFSHDAGIVYSDKGDYIIVVFSKSDLPAAAEDRIANLSKSVYEYFKEKD